VFVEHGAGSVQWGGVIVLSAKIDEKNRDVGRGDSGDAGGLGDGVWAVSLEFLSAFNG
jgi:hypothetical protein